MVPVATSRVCPAAQPVAIKIEELFPHHRRAVKMYRKVAEQVI
jgi:hypothetical protein